MTGGRLQGLDALRGIAASLVLAQHILSLLGQNWATAIAEAVDLGKVGVVLFFLISGFVIPFSLNRGLVAFWIGRAARLLPALWLSILFCIAIGADVLGPTHLFSNAFMVSRALGEPYISDPYWTLNFELYFYAVVALLFAARWLKSPAFGLLSLAAALLALVDPKAAYLIYMFIGALLRMALLEKDEAAGRWLCVALGSLGGMFFFWLATGGLDVSLLIAMALPLPMFALLWNRLSHPVLLRLGAISYSLYLFHLPILQMLDGLPPVPFALWGAALSLVVATVVYRFVERPMIAFGKRLPRKDVERARREVAAA